MGVLTVFLEKCTGLCDSDGAMNGSDPYVVLMVEKDNWGPLDTKFGKQNSTTKKGDQNPVYEETFTWDIPDDLKDLVLYVKVMDSDIGLDDKMGKCKIKLDDLDLTGDPQEVVRVVDNNLIFKDGKVHLQISHS